MGYYLALGTSSQGNSSFFGTTSERIVARADIFVIIAAGWFGKRTEEESCKLHAVCRMWRGRDTQTNTCWSGSSYKWSLWLPQMEQAENDWTILTTVNVPLMSVEVFYISSSLAERANPWWIRLSVLLVISADVEGRLLQLDLPIIILLFYFLHFIKYYVSQ